MQSDHDRPLAPRGRRTLPLLRSHVHDHAIEPDLILCSTARRCRETFDGLEIDTGRVALEPGLYSAGADQLLARLQQLDPGEREVLVVGHNPALQVLVLRLARTDDHLEEIAEKFPTGALATLTFSGDWAALRPHCADLREYVRPKALQYH